MTSSLLADAHPEAGRVLLASWENTEGVRVQILDTFGHSPYPVAKRDGRVMYATCGIVMRFSDKDDECTLVVRTHDTQPMLFRVWLLGDTPPAGWSDTVYHGAVQCRMRMAPLLRKKVALGATGMSQFVFSLFQNHVVLADKEWRAVSQRLSGRLVFTDEGRRQMPLRAKVPVDATPVVPAPPPSPPQHRPERVDAGAAWSGVCVFPFSPSHTRRAPSRRRPRGSVG